MKNLKLRSILKSETGETTLKELYKLGFKMVSCGTDYDTPIGHNDYYLKHEEEKNKILLFTVEDIENITHNEQEHYVELKENSIEIIGRYQWI